MVMKTDVRLTAENEQYPESTWQVFFFVFSIFFLNWIFVILSGLASHIFVSLGHSILYQLLLRKQQSVTWNKTKKNLRIKIYWKGTMQTVSKALLNSNKNISTSQWDGRPCYIRKFS